VCSSDLLTLGSAAARDHSSTTAWASPGVAVRMCTLSMRQACTPIDERTDELAVTGMANLAVKVADLDAAIAWYERAGAEVRDRMPWDGGERADAFLGPVMITLFTRALYEDEVSLPPETFLHPALFTDDLDAELEGHDVLWGPAEVEGTFGRRRIAFVEAPGAIRLEFMEQLEPAADAR